MDFLFNETSFKKEIKNKDDFLFHIKEIMIKRDDIKNFGSFFYCDKRLIDSCFENKIPIKKYINELDLNKKRAFVSWLANLGPFWNDNRRHNEDDYIELNEEIITDTGIAEAAIRIFYGEKSLLVSVDHEQWNMDSIIVDYHENELNKIDIPNLIKREKVLSILSNSEPPISSWGQLRRACLDSFKNITFSDDSFNFIVDYPFVNGAAKSIYEKLQVLDKIKTCFIDNGDRSKEGHELYQNFFTGDKAWFTDSTENEKLDFKSEMTFRYSRDSDPIFCPWHGKIKTPQIRIHFSYPITATTPLYIMYVGPKITKR
ncbi:hypothetical protein [Pectobacterium punjabense]|uniref:hypothetical protein n=1 Tax=Pectobacterium punjabense TaxID=2108399 RepID=UPI002B24AE0A|nr:hypothetical protein [Pectobacterium punjabense]